MKYTSIGMEPFIPFHTLVKLGDAEDITNEKSRTLDLSLEINNATSKLESQNLSAEIYDPHPEVTLTQTDHPNLKCKLRFRKNCNYCHE